MLKEFKEFAIKGNMLDMAVGIIIGVAFGKIISSLVQDIIMPVFGFIIGKVKFENLKIIIQPEIKDNGGTVIQELIALNYGNFLQVTFDFFIIAFTIFIFIKLFNSLRKKAENAKETETPTPKDIELLSEIRDLLKQKG